MPRIDNDVKLDFKDVLVRPKRSTLRSRSELQAPKKKQNYDPSLITKAYRDVTVHGYSVYKAARLHGIPESTLRDRTLGLQPVPSEGITPKPGPAPILTHLEEKLFVEHLQYMADIGYGYSRKECLRLATDYAVSLNKKKPSDPIFSDDWLSRLKKNWPELNYAKPQKLSLTRAKATSKEVLDKYYSELKSVIEDNNLTDRPDLIWNIDETGLIMEHKPTNIVCRKGFTPQSVTSTRGKTVTILACGSAIGNHLPPYYIFPGKRWCDSFLTDTSPGTAGTMTESGWSNSLVFIDYLEKHFKKFISLGQQTVLVLFDGHKSHINLTLTEWGKTNNVKFFVLPPHTSHITQPLDVACFGPLKNAYYSECQSYMRQNPGLQITRYNVGSISSKAYNKALTPNNLISAFRKTGIHPFNPEIIPEIVTSPAKIYCEETSDKTSNSAASFLQSRTISKATVSQNRKSKASLIGDICSKSSELREIPSDPKKQKQNHSVPEKKAPVPSTSGLQNRSTELYISDDSESEIENIDDDEVCCVCKKFFPESKSMQFTLDIINWGQCIKCEKWVHLKYCSNVRCLRRGSEFMCPLCDSSTSV